MTKYILPVMVMTAIAFSGCTGATSSVTDVLNVASSEMNQTSEETSLPKGMGLDSEDIKANVPESALKVGDVVEVKEVPTEDSLTDEAKKQAIEYGDSKTDGKVSKAINIMQ
jgi:hypothetical protein